MLVYWLCFSNVNESYNFRNLKMLFPVFSVRFRFQFVGSNLKRRHLGNRTQFPIPCRLYFLWKMMKTTRKFFSNISETVRVQKCSKWLYVQWTTTPYNKVYDVTTDRVFFSFSFCFLNTLYKFNRIAVNTR